jgi:outer membrane protein
VYDFGRYVHPARASQVRPEPGGDFDLEAAGDSLITRTSAAYFNVLVASRRWPPPKPQETALKKQFDFAQKRLDVGLAPITDVHEARAQYDSARANTILARNALEDAYRALTEITGQPVSNLKGLPEDFQPALPSGARTRRLGGNRAGAEPGV